MFRVAHGWSGLAMLAMFWTATSFAPFLQPLAILGVMANTLTSRDPERGHLPIRLGIASAQAGLLLFCAGLLLFVPQMSSTDLLRIVSGAFLASLSALSILTTTKELRRDAARERDRTDAFTGR